MRIVIISNLFTPVKCGLSNAVYYLSRNFVHLSQDVTVIIPYYPYEKRLAFKEKLEGVKLFRLLFPMETFYRRQINKRLWHRNCLKEICVFPLTTIKLIKLFRKERCDIVNMQFVGCYTPSVLIAKIFVKFKLVVTLQGYSSHIYPSADWFERKIFKLALKRADFIIAVSDYLFRQAGDIEPDAKEKTVVIPNGIDFKELDAQILDNERYLSSVQRLASGQVALAKKQSIKVREPFILSIASLYKINAMDILLFAFKDVLDKGYSCQLVIIGNGYERRYLEELAHILKIEEKVHFFSGLSEVSEEEVNKLVQQCLFYIRTSRIDPIGEIYPEVIKQKKTILSTSRLNNDCLPGETIVVKNDIKDISEAMAVLLCGEKARIKAEKQQPLQPRPYIFSLGRFEHYKRFDLLIRAFKRVLEMGFEVDLFIGGEGRQISDYEDLICSLGLEERVYLLGFLDRERVMRFYRKCLFFVVAFENEPFGLAVLEAMAQGKPVIAPCAGAIPELIKDGFNGILVEPDSETALAEAMACLLKDRGLIERVALAAENSVKERYRWEKIAADYLNIFKKVCGCL